MLNITMMPSSLKFCKDAHDFWIISQMMMITQCWMIKTTKHHKITFRCCSILQEWEYFLQNICDKLVAANKTVLTMFHKEFNGARKLIKKGSISSSCTIIIRTYHQHMNKRGLYDVMVVVARKQKNFNRHQRGNIIVLASITDTMT